MVALRERVRQLFEDQVRGTAFEQQNGNRRFLVSALLGDGAEGF
jgi:hypothetical protein